MLVTSAQLRQTILDILVKQYEENPREKSLHFSELHRRVNERTGKKAISYRDFSRALDEMVDEKKLRKTQSAEHKMSRLPKVYYSLTEEATKEYRLGILGINPKKERLRRLYQLLFFYSAISPIRNISQKQIDKIKNNLERESWNHTSGSNVTDVSYRPKSPINYFRIITREFSGVGPKGETKVFHYCKLWSFSEEEIVNIANRRNKRNSIIAPFVYALFPLTQQEVNEAFAILRDKYLIRPIQDLVLNKTRFVIADETLQELINEIWSVHWGELDFLKNKMNYFDTPSGEEKQWLKLIYGENEAMKIVADADRHRNSPKTDKEQVKNIQKNMSYTSNQIDSRIAYIDEKYQTKIHEYNFPIDLIKDVCFRNIFTKKRD